jgi:Zn-dependent peptidase ImmA (M78 family)
LGYFFLPAPPEDILPIPDFRTVRDAAVTRPSPDLLETVEAMQQRQVWMREFLIEERESELGFVNSTSLQANPSDVAAAMRHVLGVDDGWAGLESSWSGALVQLRRRAEAKGVLIVVNGVVGNNPHRKLRVSEFRGFALCDGYAPLVFINGTDGKAAQMFTLVHELAHLWIGRGGVSNFENLQPTETDVELFCNKVAAEFLIPEVELRAIWSDAETTDDPYGYLAGRFKVSPLVVARRALDLRLIDRGHFFSFYNHYLEESRLRGERAEAAGGNFWNTQNVRIGDRFGAAVVRAAKEGRLLFRDAYRLTGLSGTTFDRYAELLGINIR